MIAAGGFEEKAAAFRIRVRRRVPRIAWAPGARDTSSTLAAPRPSLSRVRRVAWAEMRRLAPIPALVGKVFEVGMRYPWNDMIKRATGEGLTAKYYAQQFVP